MFRKLLVPLDESDLAEMAIGRAAAIARGSGAAIDLVLAHQPLLTHLDDPTWNDKEKARQRAYLEKIARELETGSGVTATFAVIHALPVDVICERARDSNADLIVMTSHGRTGWSRAWIGSVADGVMRQSAVPVLMLRPMTRKADPRAVQIGFRRILVPLDGSVESREILAPVADLARSSSASVSLLRVVEPVRLFGAEIGVPLAYMPAMVDDRATEQVVAAAQHELDDAAAELTRRGITVIEKAAVVSPAVAPAIVDYARDRKIDVIGMSTHGRGMSRLFIGSVADKVRRGAEVPMLLLRPRRVRERDAALSDASVAAQLPAIAGVAG